MFKVMTTSRILTFITKSDLESFMTPNSSSLHEAYFFYFTNTVSKVWDIPKTSLLLLCQLSFVLEYYWTKLVI